MIARARQSAADAAAVAVMAAAAYLWAPYTSPSGPLHAAICLAAALGVVAAGSLADGIWDGSMARALGIALPGPATLARYPFRLLGGGIAVTVVMLGARKAGLLWVEDVPVGEIFATGAALAALYHAFRDTRLRRWGGASAGGANQRKGTNR